MDNAVSAASGLPSRTECSWTLIQPSRPGFCVDIWEERSTSGSAISVLGWSIAQQPAASHASTTTTACAATAAAAAAADQLAFSAGLLLGVLAVPLYHLTKKLEQAGKTYH